MLSKFTTLTMLPATWLVVMALPTGAQAQTARMRFESMDQNRDGVITRDEWRGSERAFVNHVIGRTQTHDERLRNRARGTALRELRHTVAGERQERERGGQAGPHGQRRPPMARPASVAMPSPIARIPHAAATMSGRRGNTSSSIRTANG